MSFLQKIKNGITQILDTQGYTCELCGAELFDYPDHRLCEKCDSGIVRNTGLTCSVCGRATISQGVCLTCKSHLPKFDKGYSPIVYSSTGAVLINKLKNGDKYLANFLAEEMAKGYRQSGLYKDENAIVICVPSSEKSYIERGYNQAEELAKRFAEMLDFEYVHDVLLKTKDTQPQKNKKGVERYENVKGAYRVHKRAVCKGKTVILIDDIMTTGATGSECALHIKNAGANRVIFITATSLSERK